MCIVTERRNERGGKENDSPTITFFAFSGPLKWPQKHENHVQNLCLDPWGPSEAINRSDRTHRKYYTRKLGFEQKSILYSNTNSKKCE